MSKNDFISILSNLTKEQYQICENITSHLKRDDKVPVILEAPAGAGKTYAVSKLIKFFTEAGGKSVVVSAPTHKALTVLRNKITIDNNNLIKFMTIHSVLKMKHTYNLEGEHSFYKTKDELKKEFDLWVIDEVSMIDRELCKHIKSYINRHSIRLIMLGDRLQLPPVNYHSSPIFNGKLTTFTLIENVRANTSEILYVYNVFRNYAESELIDIVAISNSMTGIGCVRVIDKNNTFNVFRELGDIENWTILSYTNKKCDYYNKTIRHYILDLPSNNFTTGDILISKKHFKVGTLRCPSSYKMRVETIEKLSTEVFGIDVDYHSMDVSCITDPNRKCPKINVVSEDSKNLLEKTIKNVKLLITDSLDKEVYTQRDIDSIWETYYEELYSVNSPVTYGYAITVHKSQGSTYNRVIIDINDIITKSRDDHKLASRLLYTAVTRAASEIILIV
eukprot:TRINITY_DN6129_c0_g2_i1.p1 TRINITY_DN6129_c0_g2~~TRINITY_DN6129_c0_g2_i1.p1  ORF type:complete len:448 (-),score=43.89 TRINITY_DN6129_c0_g2_i1:64-1407(-)